MLCALRRPRVRKKYIYVCVCVRVCVCCNVCMYVIGWTKCNLSQPQNDTVVPRQRKKKIEKLGPTPKFVGWIVCIYMWREKEMIIANQRFISGSQSQRKLPCNRQRLVSPRAGKEKEKRSTRDRFPVPQHRAPNVYHQVAKSSGTRWNKKKKYIFKKEKYRRENKRSISCAAQSPSSCVQEPVLY